MRQIGPGVPVLWSDKQTNKQTDRQTDIYILKYILELVLLVLIIVHHSVLVLIELDPHVLMVQCQGKQYNIRKLYNVQVHILLRAAPGNAAAALVNVNSTEKQLDVRPRLPASRYLPGGTVQIRTAKFGLAQICTLVVRDTCTEILLIGCYIVCTNVRLN